MRGLLTALIILAIVGCADTESTSAEQQDARVKEKEWKTFIAPLSERTQSPQERMATRTNNHT